MKIGILGAMIEEIQIIRDKMEDTKRQTIAGRDYYTGKLYGFDTVMVFSRWGKVAASSTATSVINLFNVDLIIFTGIAGAVAKELNIGDIIIGDGLYQHDMDARPIFKRYQIPLTESIIFRPKPELIEKAKKAADEFCKKINSIIPPAILAKFSITKPKAYCGIIASGDQFITNAAEHDALRLNQGEVMAVEMEGAAVAQICHEYNIPYVIIRTISDKADHSAAIDFKPFCCEIAAYYSNGIIAEFLLTLTPQPLSQRARGT